MANSFQKSNLYFSLLLILDFIPISLTYVSSTTSIYQANSSSPPPPFSTGLDILYNNFNLTPP